MWDCCLCVSMPFGNLCLGILKGDMKEMESFNEIKLDQDLVPLILRYMQSTKSILVEQLSHLEIICIQ